MNWFETLRKPKDIPQEVDRSYPVACMPDWRETTGWPVPGANRATLVRLGDTAMLEAYDAAHPEELERQAWVTEKLVELGIIER